MKWKRMKLGIRVCEDKILWMKRADSTNNLKSLMIVYYQYKKNIICISNQNTLKYQII